MSSRNGIYASMHADPPGSSPKASRSNCKGTSEQLNSPFDFNTFARNNFDTAGLFGNNDKSGAPTDMQSKQNETSAAPNHPPSKNNSRSQDHAPLLSGTSAMTHTKPLGETSDPTENQSNLAPEPCPVRAYSLQLEPAALVGASSKLPGFSIDACLGQYTGTGQTFSTYVLAAAISQGCSVEALRLYLDAFPRKTVNKHINDLVLNRHPVLFYAAERNCLDCVRLLLDYGCDAKARDVDRVPALAYAIMRSKDTVEDPIDVVKIMLAFGASPRVIPSDMWESCLDAPTASVPSNGQLRLDTAWCTDYHRKMLATSLNLSVRYYLLKASRLTVAKGRGLQIAKALNYTPLLKVPYLIIGQDYATKQVVQVVSTHLGMQRTQPLVLVFAGLSGHGKTELGKQLGALLQIPMTVIDCAQMRHDTALFGPRRGYYGSESGSQLNNHLADNSGSRSVVFLDEFDKTETEVRNSLLLVLDSGEYHDRRTNGAVDASKTIWIMATNLGDSDITAFYHKHLEGVEDKTKVPDARLVDTLKSKFHSKFGAPMAGRMRNVAPFFPFNSTERAVVAHKFLMELASEVRRPIDTTVPTLWFPGHVHLNIKNDGTLSSHIANESYSEQLGARSLQSGIDDVRNAFFAAYTNTDELVTDDMNAGALMKFTVQLLPVTGDDGEKVVSRVNVAADGYSEYHRSDEAEMEGDEDIDTFDEEL